MQVRHFCLEQDLTVLEAFLGQRYLESVRLNTWLPARLHDIIYRVGPMERDEGREQSFRHIYWWEDEGKTVACILPDGENTYVSILPGYEELFPQMVAFSEGHCRMLFPAGEDGKVKFWFAISDEISEAIRYLEERGYQPFPDKEYASSAHPAELQGTVAVPEGYRVLFGEEEPDEEKKWGALRLGFHPEEEGPDFVVNMNPYLGRKQSSLYPDSFECMVVEESSTESNPICSYCFVYVDKQTSTALIEPVSTREQHRHKGLGTAMLRSALGRLQFLGIEKCYVDNFGWRKDFYEAAGFQTESSTSFWYKVI